MSVYHRLTKRRRYLFSSSSMHAQTGNRQTFFRRRPRSERGAKPDERKE